MVEIYITKIVCPSVCLSVNTCSAGTPWPMIVKFCTRNLHVIWKISTEKNFGKSKKKKLTIFFFKIFSKFFRNFLNFFSLEIFCGNKNLVFSARATVGGQRGGEAPLKASEASLAPQASHQPPKAASVRVYSNAAYI